MAYSSERAECSSAGRDANTAELPGPARAHFRRADLPEPARACSEAFAHTRRSPLGPARDLLRSAAPRSRPFAHTRRSPLGPARDLLRTPPAAQSARPTPQLRGPLPLEIPTGARCIQLETFCAAPRRPPGARSGLFRGFCAAPVLFISLGATVRTVGFSSPFARVLHFAPFDVHEWLSLSPGRL